MLMVVGNLPDDITEAGIREALGADAPVDRIKLLKEGLAPFALVEIRMTAEPARGLARRVHGSVYGGRALTAWLPLPGWTKVQ